MTSKCRPDPPGPAVRVSAFPAARYPLAFVSVQGEQLRLGRHMYNDYEAVVLAQQVALMQSNWVWGAVNVALAEPLPAPLPCLCSPDPPAPFPPVTTRQHPTARMPTPHCPDANTPLRLQAVCFLAVSAQRPLL